MNSPAGRITRALRIQAACDFHRAQVVSADGVRSRVPVGARRTVTVPLEPGPGGRCTTRFTVTPTKVPGKRDRRRLGIHFLSFEYARP